MEKEILSDLEEYPYYVLINEKFILDTYYFMTNLKDIINDPEYTFGEENWGNDENIFLININ